MKKTTVTLAIGLLLSGMAPSITFAADFTPDQQAVQGQHQMAWLGIGVDYIPEPLLAHLSASVPAGQGLMITGVEAGSPAAAAGLQTFDILLGYADQKLYSPQQLTSLIRGDSAGNEVALEYVHQGEVLSTKVTLASMQQANAARGWPPAMSAFPRHGSRFPGFQGMPMMPNQPPMSGNGNRGGNVMRSFNAQSITQINGEYQIEVTYLDKDGIERKSRYQGNRDEVQKVITEDTALPDDQRQQLLDALNTGNMAVTRDMRSLMQNFHRPFFQRPWFDNGWRR